MIFHLFRTVLLFAYLIIVSTSGLIAQTYDDQIKEWDRVLLTFGKMKDHNEEQAAYYKFMLAHPDWEVNEVLLADSYHTIYSNKINKTEGFYTFLQKLKAKTTKPELKQLYLAFEAHCLAKEGKSEHYYTISSQFNQPEKLPYNSLEKVILAASTFKDWPTVEKLCKAALPMITRNSFKERLLKQKGMDFYETRENFERDLNFQVSWSAGTIYPALGESLIEQGRPDEALKFLLGARDAVPKNGFSGSESRLNLQLARIYKESGKYQAAIDALAIDSFVGMYSSESLTLLKECFFLFKGKNAVFEPYYNQLRSSYNIKPIPDMKLKDYSGKIVSLNQLMGKVTILNVWSIGCGPCREEMPVFQRLWEKYKEKGLSIIVIDAYSTTKDTSKYLKENNFTFHALENRIVNGKDLVTEQLHVHVYPTTYILDSNLNIWHFQNGYSPELEAEYEKVVKLLLAR